MKKRMTALLAISGLALALQVSPAATENEKTIVGDGACAKCTLKETKDCQHAIIADEDGKKVTYYVTQNAVAKEFGDSLCSEKKKIKATGKVKVVNDKRFILPTKMEVAKE